MDLATPATFLRRLLRRRPRQEIDPANMGTVFGLEASLGPVRRDPAGDEPSATERGAETPMSWLARRLASER